MSNLREQNIPDADLSDLGAPPKRGAGLAGLVGTSTTAAVDTGQDNLGEPIQEPGHGVDSATSGAARRPVRRRRATVTASARNKPTSAVYVSAGVKKRFVAYRHAKKATNLQVVLEAIGSKHGELAGIIRKSTVNSAPVNDLFAADPTAVRYLGGGSIQIGFSPTPEQETKLDEIGKELGFDTRSTWIAPVLNEFLPGRKDTQRDS